MEQQGQAIKPSLDKPLLCKLPSRSAATNMPLAANDTARVIGNHQIRRLDPSVILLVLKANPFFRHQDRLTIRMTCVVTFESDRDDLLMASGSPSLYLSHLDDDDVGRWLRNTSSNNQERNRKRDCLITYSRTN